MGIRVLDGSETLLRALALALAGIFNLFKLAMEPKCLNCGDLDRERAKSHGVVF
jgi:hypothetical protein